MNAYRSRKFWLCAATIAAATALCVLRLLDGSQWVTAVGGALAIYSASNVSQKVFAK